MEPETTTAAQVEDGASPEAASKLDENLLTLEDVAILASQGDQLPKATICRLAAVVRTDPRFAGHYEWLEVVAQDIVPCPPTDGDLEMAWACHQDYERLLAAEGWEHPAEVLDPGGEAGVAYNQLVRLAAARASRAPNAPKVVAIKEKLERAWADLQAKDQTVADFVARLEEFEQ